MLLKYENCNECHETKPVDGHTFDGVCGECKAIKYKKEKRMALAALKGLTIEERLEKIEEQLYELPRSIRANYEPKHHKYA